jgi:HAD superfamily hydrolase (TIGR01509 family)
MIKAVLFDIDGTILDSVDLHAKSWVLTLSHFGIEAGFEDVRSHIGEGADRLLPAFLPKGASRARGREIEEYRSHLFKIDFLPRVRPFPKIRELIERIKKDDRKVALASSCTEDEIVEYEKIAAISDIVDCVSTSDDAQSSKPAPDIFLKAVERLAPITAEECVVIGDTLFDGEAARKAKISFIGVLCGGSSAQQLAEAGAIAIYKDPADLLTQYATSPICQPTGNRQEAVEADTRSLVLHEHAAPHSDPTSSL